MQVLKIIAIVFFLLMAAVYQRGMRLETLLSPEDAWGLIIIGLALVAMGLEESK
jgi:hypothetical protein